MARRILRKAVRRGARMAKKTRKTRKVARKSSKSMGNFPKLSKNNLIFNKRVARSGSPRRKSRAGTYAAAAGVAIGGAVGIRGAAKRNARKRRRARK